MTDRIEQIALEVCGEMLQEGIKEPSMVDFLRRCLSKMAEGVEPVAYIKEWNSVGHARTRMRRVDLTNDCETWLANVFPTITKLYATPAEAILAAENTVAEAIAKMFADSGIGGEHLANEVRSGKWREYQ